MVNVQIVSDTHLEFRGENFQKLIKPSAPILLLLGDICACGTLDDFNIYKKFMTFLSSKFEHIFHVPGNHEYYAVGGKQINKCDTMPGVDLKIRKFVKGFNNVYFLNNDTMRLKIGNKNYVFVGSTLWSHVRPEDRRAVGNLMNDYEHIYIPNTKPKKTSGVNVANWNPVRKYNIEDMSKLHTKSVRYIKKVMKDIKPNETAILLTHHKPVRDVDESEIISQAYESNLKDVIICPPFKLACFGHTHVKYNKVVSNVRVVSNPKGYVSQKTKFDDKFTINI
jgi:predicted phosphodiesterase